MERTLTRRSIGAADCHPLSVRRFAPSIKRMQRTVAPANKFASAPAADPQPRYAEIHLPWNQKISNESTEAT